MTVIKTESVEYMPFFLSFFLFLNAGIWSAYAVLVKDFYVGVSLTSSHLHSTVVPTF
jgi:solute carrier family 50 protein (sugar transporter)